MVVRENVQRCGKFLSSMIIPNIGVFYGLGNNGCTFYAIWMDT